MQNFWNNQNKLVNVYMLLVLAWAEKNASIFPCILNYKPLEHWWLRLEIIALQCGKDEVNVERVFFL